MAQGLVRIGERQAQHGVHAAARFGQRLLRKPAIVGPAQLALHLLLRMQTDIEHPGREQARIVDAHGIHPALAELDVAHPAGIGLLRRPHRVARDASSHVLGEAGLRRYDGAPTEAAAADRELSQNVVLHERKDLVVALVLVMVRVAIDDQHFVVFPLRPPAVARAPGACVVFNSSTEIRRPRSAMSSICVSPGARSASAAFVRAGSIDQLQLCHMPSSNTARLTARSSPHARGLFVAGGDTLRS